MPKTPLACFRPEAASPKPCYLFIGSDTVAASAAMRKVLRVVAESEDSPDVERFDAEHGTVTRVAECVAIPPLFSSRRFVVVRKVSRLTSKEASELADLIPNLPPSACLLLCMDPEPSAGRPFVDKSTEGEKALIRAVEKNGIVVDCSPAEAAQGKQQLIALAAERSVKLSNRSAETLWRLCNQDFAEARAQLEKIAEYAPLGTEITDEDVRAIVAEKRQPQVFAFADAVAEGNLGAALGHLDAIVANRSRPEEAATQTVLPQLSRHFRLAWQARALLELRIPVQDWSRETKNPVLPREHNLAELATRSESVASKYARLARRLDPERIALALTRIAEADAALKGMGPGASVTDILGRLVTDLCQLCQARSTGSRAAGGL